MDHSTIAEILYGSYIRYDRMYEMTKFAFYGKTDSNSVNVFIDAYSILRSLYTRGLDFMIDDSCVIASCIINLAIHIRAYFETRHHVTSKVYIIYGGARPLEAFVNYPYYNFRNMAMEDSNDFLKNLVKDNMEIISILCPYLYDIFCIVDYENEFSVITSAIISKDIMEGKDSKTPNIIYSKEALAYQLVAYKPYTFLYRPKKRRNEDCSWVVTKSTLYNAYRHGEIGNKTEINTSVNVGLFSAFQAIAGLSTRNLGSIRSNTQALKDLNNAVANNVITNGYHGNTIFYSSPNMFEKMYRGTKFDWIAMTNHFAAIDLLYQTSLYETKPESRAMRTSIINLYNPQEVRNINDTYFQKYPLDLNRV